MIIFYKIFSIIIISSSAYAYAMHDVMKSFDKQIPRLIRSIVPSSSFTAKDLKIDERQKTLLKNARPLNAEKSIYELRGNPRKESFHTDQLALVTRSKPAFIDRFYPLSFLNAFFDGRIRVDSPLKYPYTSISHLVAVKPMDNKIIFWRGSGFLIGPRVLLTARHCVDAPFGNGETNISFNALFGKTGDTELFNAKALDLHKHSKRDIALVLLDYEVGLHVGALKLSRDFKENQKVSVVGYPGVKTVASYFKNAGETEMYGMVGPLLTVSGGKLTYSLDTSGGQSGGPISNILTEELKEYTAYGVHTQGATAYNVGEAYDENFEEFLLSGEEKFLKFLEKNPNL